MRGSNYHLNTDHYSVRSLSHDDRAGAAIGAALAVSPAECFAYTVSFCPATSRVSFYRSPFKSEEAEALSC